ncbi:MAG: hypothetical protein EA393_04905 [Bacteroidetes bacterium]|nr:MAG: hypothetical protein EA393_04905 [Bacteroidota bacterium]
MLIKKLPCTLILIILFSSCETDTDMPINLPGQWKRHPDNPVYRDHIPEQNYEVASDPHVFFDEKGQLYMIYTGDVNGYPGIKLAKGKSWSEWEYKADLVYETGPSGWDIHKETAFYRLASSGKHQIYYIGYPNEENYESQLFLAEADEITGPYVQHSEPIITIGLLAGKPVHLITSPSVVEHDDQLYLTFLAWDGFQDVTMVWVMGAVSHDDGATWDDIQEVNVPIGMEGQVTRMPDGSFCAVRTAAYQNVEAIWFSMALHPFGPWEEQDQPILVQEGAPWEVNEVIAPQITVNPDNEQMYLYYTGADYQKGWWVMLAEPDKQAKMNQ